MKTMSARAAYVAVTCLAAIFACGMLAAQSGIGESTTRTVEGRVTNAENQPVENAVVQLKNSKTLQIRSFITQADGNYHFAGLQTDVEYQVKADHDGVSTPWKTLSVFNSKKTPVINLKLKK
jgi:protocatechuate 3,4-dioxygenase beta subunit